MTPRHEIVHGRLRRIDGAPAAGAALLMTATLQPPAGAVARDDPRERLHDYLSALRHYLGLPDDTVDRIVFVDNSAVDLGPLIDLATVQGHGKRVEFIAFDGNHHPPQAGKAYGEFKLLDHGLATSRLLGPDDIVWKTTGRLKFLNLPQMARKLGDGFDFACDLHALPFIGSRDPAARRVMDLRVFAFRTAAWDAELRGLWQSHPTGFDATHLYRAMTDARARHRVVPRFPLQPRLQGISGRHQRDYQAPMQRAKDQVRAVGRRLAPWIWL